MMHRTTITATPDDLATLKAEARRRGLSLAAYMCEVVAGKASEIRATRVPRFGLGRSGQGTSTESVEDEDSPVATPFRT